MIEVDGSVWAVGDGTLWRIDAGYDGPPSSPQSTFPETVDDAILGSSPIGDPALLATGGGHVWSLSETDGDPGTPVVLQELEPGTGAALGEPIPMTYTGPVQLAVGPDGYPWITFEDHGVLAAVRPADEPISDEPSTDTVDAARCQPPTVRPTYLPWIEPGEQIPPPVESYDDEIGRSQLSWTEPAGLQGRIGVGLTVYTHTPLGDQGEEIDIELEGVTGRLHREDEGGLVGISWSLQTSECNFVELVLSAPGLSRNVAIEQLIRVARSLA